jgi:hypothetical protein
MLRDKPGHFTFDGTWKGVPMMCHNATLFWLYEDEFNKTPTLDQYLKFSTLGPTAIIGNMLPYGRKLRKPASGAVALTAGAVIVFVRNGQPVHSCVAMQHDLVGGYNQVGWFQRNGVPTGFSTHLTTEIRWKDGNQVIGSHNSLCVLVEVPEMMAKAVMRQAAQG